MRKMTLIAPLVLALAVLGLGTANAQTLTAQDYAEIRQLYAQYNLMIDTGDAEGWADVFTEDGVFGPSQGRAALIEFATGFYEGQKGYSRHWNDNVRITPTADGASGTCYLLLWNMSARPASIIATGIYEDTLVKTADGWRFKSRNANIDTPAAAGQ